MVPDIPIACSLSDPELREREATVLRTFAAHVRGVEARPDGYLIELEPTDEAIAAATAVIVAERLCCPFLRFDLTVDAPGETRAAGAERSAGHARVPRDVVRAARRPRRAHRRCPVNTAP